MSSDPFTPSAFSIRSVWALFLLAFLLRLGFVLHHAQLGWQLQYDPGYYLTLAYNLRHGVYSLFHPLDIPDTSRMPGYPFVIFLLGGSVPAVLTIQVFISALKVPLVFQLARQAGITGRFAWAAAALMAIEPMDVLLAGTVLTETIFTSLLLTGVLFVVRGPSWRHVVIAALCFAAATWFRPNGMFLLILAASCALLLLRRSAAKTITFAALGLLLILPWVLRNQRTTGRFVLSDGGAVAAAYFHVPQVLAVAGDPRAEGYRQTLNGLASSTDWEDPVAASGFFTEVRHRVRRTFTQHPLAWTWVHARKTLAIYLAPGRGHVRNFFGVRTLSTVALVALSTLISALLLLSLLSLSFWIRQMPSALIFLLLMAGAVVFSGAISTADARFKNPAMPLLLVGAAWAAQQFLQRRRARLSS